MDKEEIWKGRYSVLSVGYFMFLEELKEILNLIEDEKFSKASVKITRAIDKFENLRVPKELMFSEEECEQSEKVMKEFKSGKLKERMCCCD